jgi:hypothetical protein
MMPPSRKMSHGKPCPYCKRLMQLLHAKLQPTVDHVIPQSNDGKETIICCLQCNGIKANMLPPVWASFMAAHPGWWALSKLELRNVRRGAFQPPGEPPRRPRQGSPPQAPVVVPPDRIWSRSVRPPWHNPELVQQTVEQDALLRTATDDAPPLRSDEACLP